jgi:hypothetical protein
MLLFRDADKQPLQMMGSHEEVRFSKPVQTKLLALLIQ